LVTANRAVESSVAEQASNRFAPMSHDPDRRSLFLSCVTSEFGSYRELLTGDLKRPTLEVKVQEDFVVSGGTTLEKLDDYIRACDGVIHLIGDATGAVAEVAAVERLLQRYSDLAQRLKPLAPALAGGATDFSYTQWEAYLAIYHDRPIFIYRKPGRSPSAARCRSSRLTSFSTARGCSATETPWPRPAR
jgi:hypothetical protein